MYLIFKITSQLHLFKSHLPVCSLLGAGGVGGLDQGEELHLGSSGLWEGSEQCAEITTKTQDSGWRTAGSPVTAAGVCACL